MAIAICRGPSIRFGTLSGPNAPRSAVPASAECIAQSGVVHSQYGGQEKKFRSRILGDRIAVLEVQFQRAEVEVPNRLFCPFVQVAEPVSVAAAQGAFLVIDDRKGGGKGPLEFRLADFLILRAKNVETSEEREELALEVAQGFAVSIVDRHLDKKAQGFRLAHEPEQQGAILPLADFQRGRQQRSDADSADGEAAEKQHPQRRAFIGNPHRLLRFIVQDVVVPVGQLAQSPASLDQETAFARRAAQRPAIARSRYDVEVVVFRGTERLFLWRRRFGNRRKCFRGWAPGSGASL